jgi:hypothetical protein
MFVYRISPWGTSRNLLSRRLSSNENITFASFDWEYCPNNEYILFSQFKSPRSMPGSDILQLVNHRKLFHHFVILYSDNDDDDDDEQGRVAL